MLKKYNYNLEYIPIDEMHDFCDTKRYFEGLFDSNAFHFHPMNYCLGLANEVERLGGLIFEDSAMISTDRKIGERKVYTAYGEVTCKDMIFCGGGYSGPEAQKLFSSFLPISTYMVVTEPLGELANKIIKRNHSFCDDRRASDYYRLVDGDRLLWGSRITTKNQPEVARLTKMLKRDMCSVYPQLEDVKIDKAWSGLMGYASHKMPIIRRQDEGIWFCSSFGGHGMNTGSVGGRVVAEGICGKSDRYRLFEPFGLKWNGGVLGPITANIVYKSLSMMDYIQEYNH
jgi:gamma-glutamylputrescine oxidase